MAIESVVISSGHGQKVRGASGNPVPPQLDEVDMARMIADRLAEMFESVGVDVQVFHDNVSTSVDANLSWLVSHHNSAGPHDLDISVHLNCYDHTAHGTECLYVTQKTLAQQIGQAMANAGGFTLRGDKGAVYRGDLYFLNNTKAPAVLLEVAFCDNTSDCDKLNENFEAVCEAVAEAISGLDVQPLPPDLPPFNPDPGPDPEPPFPTLPTLRKGDSGQAVIYLQEQLNSDIDAGLVTDGDFGNQTDSAVRNFQSSRRLDVDGIVGPQTWGALYFNVPAYVPPGLPDPLSEADQDAIRMIAANSAIAKYSWKDRGKSPAGYVKGVALTFANVYRKWLVGHEPAREMAKGRSSSDKDVFNEFEKELDNAGLDPDAIGEDALINLFAIMLGLGMRESSGKHCCGRDQSASNTDSETCEAGAWQTSWNAHNCADVQDQTFDEYSAGGGENPQGFLSTFKEDVSCSSADWSNYGSGDGYRHQDMSKNQPAYAAEFAAVTLRNLCNHYGPIVRHEAEVKADAARMFKAIKDYVDESTPSA